MSTHLKAHNIWGLVKPSIQEGANPTTQKRDQLALSQIYQEVDYSVFGRIANAKTAKEAWDILKFSYKSVDKAQQSKLQSLHRDYEKFECPTQKLLTIFFSCY